MDCSLYFKIYILLYYFLRTQSKMANNKGSGILPKTSVANDLPNDESKPIDTYIDREVDFPKHVTQTFGSPTYPFMVSIQRSDMGKYTHLCGGSILNKWFVLTAAHCTLKPRQLLPKDLTVVGGSTKLFDKNTTRFRVKALRKHPQFIPLKGNDIILIQMETEIPIDNIRFGTIDYRDRIRKSGGLDTFLLGWGRTSLNETKELEVIPFHTVEDKECFLDFRFKYLTNSEICAMNSKGPRGACDGDSGGPLVDESQQSLYGMLSYGRTPCEIGKPFAFTRISVYVDWIEQQMANMLKTNVKRIK